MSGDEKKDESVDESTKDNSEGSNEVELIEKMERPEPWPDPPAENESKKGESE